MMGFEYEKNGKNRYPKINDKTNWYMNQLGHLLAICPVGGSDFQSDVKKIIKDAKIPFSKIALELTETQDEHHFHLLKEKMQELQACGIKFYLDDFGTGYSNFLRIMELPFEIIKFDRSMVIAAMRQVKSETIVSYLAHMFSDMGYSVLYEGIETEDDEVKCLNMYARYLQGYKYSIPIPMEELDQYFEKEKVVA